MPAEEEQDDKGGKQPKDKEGKTPKEKEAGKQPKEKEKEGKQPKEQDGTPPKEKASKPKEKESKQPKEKDDKEPKKKESKPPKEKEPPASEEGEEDGEEDEASPPAPDACPADSAAEQSESNGRGRSRNLHELKETLESTADRALADAARVKEQAVKFKDSVVSDVTRHFEAVRSVLPASKSQALSALQNTDLRFLAKAPWLLGLFVPPPSWPPEPLTVKAPRLAATVLAFGVLCAMVAGSACAVGLMFVWLGAVIVPVLFLLAPVLLAGYLAAWVYYRHRPRLGPPPSMYEFRRANAEAAEKAEAKALEEIKNMERLMREDTRSEEAHSEFVAHVKEATSLAIYGCGILAAAHVGGLFALERYGLQYDKLQTMAGVSAGAVIVACLSVGYEAEAVYELVANMPFHRLAYPELGAVFRMLGNTLLTLAQVVHRQGAVPWALREISIGNGPGINSGAELDRLMGDALAKRPGIGKDDPCPCGSGKRHRACCAPNITLKQVKEEYGKRLIILVTELDTGRERQLTPETDPDLPLRVACRMSMGVPGMIEPFKYEKHVYCDGGMCNDFPMNSLPDDGHRLGLMVRPKDWYMYNFGSLHRLKKGSSTKEEEDQVISELSRMEERMQEQGIYPVRDGVDLATTCMQTMMDANLALQIRMATGSETPVSQDGSSRGGAWPRSWATLKSRLLQTAPQFSEDSDGGDSNTPVAGRSGGGGTPVTFFKLAPQIMTLCGGSFSPFDFALSKMQHQQLFIAGQICVHLTAAQHVATLIEKECPTPAEDKESEADDPLSTTSFITRAAQAAAAAAGQGGSKAQLSGPVGAKKESQPEPGETAPVLSRQTKLNFLLYLLHLDYPK